MHEEPTHLDKRSISLNFGLLDPNVVNLMEVVTGGDIVHAHLLVDSHRRLIRGFHVQSHALSVGGGASNANHMVVEFAEDTLFTVLCWHVDVLDPLYHTTDFKVDLVGDHDHSHVSFWRVGVVREEVLTKGRLVDQTGDTFSDELDIAVQILSLSHHNLHPLSEKLAVSKGTFSYLNVFLVRLCHFLYFLLCLSYQNLFYLQKIKSSTTQGFWGFGAGSIRS